MKKHFILLFALLVLPSVTAVNIDVEIVNSSNIMVPNIDKPATFAINITNNGDTQEFGIFTPVVSKQNPGKSERFEIESGKSRVINLKLYPPLKGTSNFEYYISGKGETYTGKLNVRYVELEDVFEVGSESIHPERNSVEIYLENTIGVNFKNINAEFSSPFFEIERSFSIGPNERKTFEKELNRKDFNEIRAGFYTLNARINVDNETVNSVGNIEFESREKINTSRKEKGFLVKRKMVTKSNAGNVEEDITIRIEKGIISRIFTSTTPRADIVDRDGSTVYYTWDRTLGPGESLNVNATTNWIYPIIVLILLVAAIVGIKKYLQTDLKVKKKTKFVKSKGDEFALRVDLFVEARRSIENIVVMDKLPPLLKLYKKFGKEKPKNVDEDTKKIEWEFDSLEPGEKRMISYVAYSKVKVVGKFALPKARGTYERDGKVKESSSNR
ncbi:MAG: hypothetical protein ABEI74_02280, partial [Candidatus Pacearchaeota archaeon]